MKKRILIGAGALVLAAAPAALGLWGNTSFAESVPVPVPVSGQVVTVSPSPSVDDHGGEIPRDQRVEPGDDRATVDDSAVPSTTPDDSSGSGRGSDDSGSGRHGGGRGGEGD